MGIKDIGDNVRRHMKIRGLTIAKLSELSEMGTAAISNILNAKAEPKSSTLLKLAEALSVPFNELLADSPRLSSIRFRSARALSGREKAERDQVRHDSAIWLSDYCFLEKALDDKPACLLESHYKIDPHLAAKAIREHLGLKDSEPIYDIAGMMERAGIKLRLRPYGFKKTFGLSIGPEDGGPAIVINSEPGISVERQIFTIAHELGHLVLHKASYRDPEEMEDKGEEDEANLFAGNFLVPDTGLAEAWEESKGLAFVDRVLRVKKVFKVSYKTILVRLAQMNHSIALVDLVIRFSRDYKAKYQHDLKEHYEPEALRHDTEPVALEDPQELDTSDLMEERFARLVRSAYERELISMSRAGEMLNLSIHEMRTLTRAWQEM